MNIIKITDIANEIVDNPKYIQTEVDADDIEGLIAAFQHLINVYTDYGKFCSVTKDMVIYLLTAYCGCELTDNVVNLETDKWIDIAEIIYLHNGNNEFYLPHIRKIKKTEFFQKICNFFDDENCVDYVQQYNLKTILERY